MSSFFFLLLYLFITHFDGFCWAQYVGLVVVKVFVVVRHCCCWELSWYYEIHGINFRRYGSFSSPSSIFLLPFRLFFYKYFFNFASFIFFRDHCTCIQWISQRANAFNMQHNINFIEMCTANQFCLHFWVRHVLVRIWIIIRVLCDDHRIQCKQYDSPVGCIRLFFSFLHSLFVCHTKKCDLKGTDTTIFGYKINRC